ncbi:serine O-acetyltransferase [Amphiplicatus metriothermophilus]|uniref:Serine acetyltransferase n=1 Tax=Amphiplicatus metriothermophilus TaxID=1519374 RepID=A0A239PW89_9PROT|nr:hypothetical protein [Amphiplicatus metriothermophilus]MBB5518943.1 serine O-acetyltransferase [Amphiplicatus metriothermophilus]SNT74515.1 serine O-acetyltransferase [Amphiplicatus metriothermophilus]
MFGMLRFWIEPGEKIVANQYRYRRWKNRKGPIAALVRGYCKFQHRYWRFVTTCLINIEAEIHPTAKLIHAIGVMIHKDAVIGENCMIMQHVTLGQLAGPGAPKLGRNVYVGAGARVLGPVTIGDNARIGANAVVIKDVPANATAVGVPARIILRDEPASSEAAPESPAQTPSGAA